MTVSYGGTVYGVRGRGYHVACMMRLGGDMWRRRVPLAGGTTGSGVDGYPWLAGRRGTRLAGPPGWRVPPWLAGRRGPLAGGTTGSPGWRGYRVDGTTGSPPAGGSTGSPGWRVDGYPAGGSPRLAGTPGWRDDGVPWLAGRRVPLAGGGRYCYAESVSEGSGG